MKNLGKKNPTAAFIRAPDKKCILSFNFLTSSPHPMFDHLLKSSQRDDSNKWSNIGYGKIFNIGSAGVS